jgi:hypothetical protein
VRDAVLSPAPPAVARPTVAAPAPAAPSSRWHLYGALSTLALAVLVGVAARRLAGLPGASRLVLGLAVAAGSVLVVTAAVATVAAARERRTPGSALGALLSLYTNPPGAWAMALLGIVLAAPFLALVTDVVSDADSARLLATTDHVREEGAGYLVDTQEVLVPHAVFGPLVAAGGIVAARVVSVASLMALSGVLAAVTWRLTRAPTAALATALGLLCIYIVAGQANRLPMYLGMLALGYLGGWLAYRATHAQGGRRVALAVGAGVGLALCLETHAVGQLFLAVPALVLVLGVNRRSLTAVALTYLAAGTALVPRLLINVSEGGLSALRSNRTDYWVQNGYLARINREYWFFETHGPLDYLTRIPDQLRQALGWTGLVVGLLTAVALVLSRGRSRWFGVAAAGLFVAALVVKVPPPFPRYLAPILPGMALASGLAVDLLRRRGRGGRRLAAAAVGVLTVGAVLSYSTLLARSGDAAERVRASRLHELADVIDDGRGVIGARAGQLLYVDRRIPVWGTLFLSEEEFATYLTWPSDAKVIEVLRRHDIGWALVSLHGSLEFDYHNVWLRPSRGQTARHLEALFASPSFCRMPVPADAGYILYRLGPCGSEPPPP